MTPKKTIFCGLILILTSFGSADYNVSFEGNLESGQPVTVEVTENDSGIEGVEMYVDESYRGETNSQGEIIFTPLTDSTYDIRLEHNEFTANRNLNISPETVDESITGEFASSTTNIGIIGLITMTLASILAVIHFKRDLTSDLLNRISPN